MTSLVSRIPDGPRVLFDGFSKTTLPRQGLPFHECPTTWLLAQFDELVSRLACAVEVAALLPQIGKPTPGQNVRWIALHGLLHEAKRALQIQCRIR